MGGALLTCGCIPNVTRSRVFVTVLGMVTTGLVVVALASVSENQPGGQFTVEDGRQLEQKLSQIFRNAATQSEELRTVVIDEREINAYFEFQGARLLPGGVADPTLALLGTGRVAVAATVDLDQVRNQGARGALDPLRYVSGRLQVSATAVLQASNHIGQLEIESASIDSVQIPTVVLFELVRFYTRTAQQPDGVDLEASFGLPHEIESVRVEQGQVVIVQ